MLKKHLCLLVKTTVHPSSHMVPLMLMDCQLWRTDSRSLSVIGLGWNLSKQVWQLLVKDNWLGLETGQNKSVWSRDRIHPINDLDSSNKPHVTWSYQSVVWKMLKWNHVSRVSSSTDMFYITVWMFMRVGKHYITHRRGPSTNVSYFHYCSGLIFTHTHTHTHI